MSNVYDKAVIEWANDRLVERDYPRDAIGLRFEGWDGCYSSWTQDYGVAGTIVRTNGVEVRVEYLDTWLEVLGSLAPYVAAVEQMESLHDHGWDSQHPEKCKTCSGKGTIECGDSPIREAPCAVGQHPCPNCHGTGKG